MPTEKLNELLKKPLTATGTVALVAAKDAEGKPVEGGNKSMTINAYNGGLMDVGWGLPVGIDLSGVTWRDDNAVPILCQHDAHNIDAICGQAKKIKCEGSSIMVDADFMPVSETAKKVHELAKAGFKFQASVGVTPSDVLYVDAETAYNLNGAEVKGECYIVRAGLLHEVSIVPLGADNSTATAIAAASHRKEPAMATETKKEVEAAKPVETANVEAALKAERDRVASISKVCEGHADIMAQAVEGGWTAEKAELECLKAEKAEAQKLAKEKEIQAARPGAPAIVDLKAAAPKDAKTVLAAICMGAGMADAKVEAQNKGVDLDAAHDLGIHRLSDVFAAFGCGYNPGDANSIEKSLRAAFSTANIPNVLSNAAGKFVDLGFGQVSDDWRKVARSVSVKDFKPVTGVLLRMGGVLKPLSKGGEIQHTSLADEARTLKAETKAIMVAITREDLINDDLGILANVPTEIGNMAGRTINKDVFDVLNAIDPSAFGATATGVLNVANLADAYGKARKIKDGNDFVYTMPNTILTPTESYLTALNIYQSELITGASAEKGKNNVMRGRFTPVESPFLTGTAYYLFDPTFGLVDVAFLNGRQTPVVETANVDFNQLGIQMRCYFDYGAQAGRTKLALRSTGAAA